MPHLKIGDQQLEYVWHGPGPAEALTLVFLHEGLGCVAMWRDFPERLAAETGCGALVYSRAGYGNSDRCELPRSVRFMHDEALLVLPQVLNAFQIREAILVGHSDGGSIALINSGGPVNHEDTKNTKTADRNRNELGDLSTRTLIRGLILEAPHVFVEEPGLESIRAIAEDYRKAAAGRMPANRPQDAGAPERTAIVNLPSSERDAGRMPANRPSTHPSAAASPGTPGDADAPADAPVCGPSVLKQRLARYHGENVDQTFWGWNDVWLNPEFRTWNIEEYLPHIRVPILLIQGKDDQYGTPAQVKAIQSACQAPVRTVWLAECGHSPHLDQSARTIEAMKEFVSEVVK